MEKYKIAIITISDTASVGQRVDKSGQLIREKLQNDYDICYTNIISDDKDGISAELVSVCQNEQPNIILTTGGTGCSPRDNTPEATLAVIEKNVYGISEAMRMGSMKITNRAMLSRGVSGILGKTLIINLPGSPKACDECLDIISDVFTHAIEIICNYTNNCART